MPLFRDSSNSRVYLIEPQFIKWLTNDQFNLLQQPYVSVPGASFNLVCGAYEVPNNRIPTTQGAAWNFHTDIQQNIALTSQRVITEISAKIDSTHTS